MKPDFTKFAYTGKLTKISGYFQLYFKQEGYNAVLYVGLTFPLGHWISTDGGRYSDDLTPEETELLLMKLR